VSPHFTLWELGISNSAAVPAQVKLSILTLMELLEGLREACGNKPVAITSGYRSPEHNEAINGSRGSQHMAGEAADLVVIGMKPRDVWQTAHALNVGQCIVYGIDGPDAPGNFVHISLPNEARKIRGQFLWTPSRGGSNGPYHTGDLP